MAERTGKNIFFTPSDVSTVLDIAEWTDYLTDIVEKLRKQLSSEIKKKNNIVQELEDFKLFCDKNPLFQNDTNKYNALNIFQAYKNLISLSLKLRQLLQNYVPNIQVYDDIKYALYYDNERYFIDEIKADWITVNSKGELFLRMDKAVEDIKQLENKGEREQKQKIRQVLSEHYEKYLQMISKTYKMRFGKNAIPVGKRGAKINQGRVAEAFEEHLIQHHNFMSIHNFTLNENSPIYIIEQQNKYRLWSEHESTTEGWVHIRHSLGTQRGTVAGDVGNIQVKQLQSSTTNALNKISLSALANLKDGIACYSKILDTTIPATDVAFELAKYLSEPISEKAADMLNLKSDEEFVNKLPEDLKLARKKRKNIYLNI